MFLKRQRATTPNPPTPASPYREVIVLEQQGRHDVFECRTGEAPAPSNWVASFKDLPDAQDFRRRRLRLPWRITAS
jgi:hypothetical protein